MTQVLIAYGIIIVSLVAYLAFIVLKGRSLWDKVKPDMRRFID